MIRAKKARGHDNDDIPLARRVGTISSGDFVKAWNFRIRFFFLFFLIIFLLLISFFNKQNNVKENVELYVTKNGQLLGHFPYKEASNSKLSYLPNGMKIHADVINDLTEMIAQASYEGVQLVIISAFRSEDLQKEIFYETKSSRNQIAIERAKVSAPPGYSEHSTGYAVDFGDRYMKETDFEVSFESTPSFKWLRANAARYHFVLSFPKANKQGVNYEPWHWRYEGSVEALKTFNPANRFSRK